MESHGQVRIFFWLGAAFPRRLPLAIFAHTINVRIPALHISSAVHPVLLNPNYRGTAWPLPPLFWSGSMMHLLYGLSMRLEKKCVNSRSNLVLRDEKYSGESLSLRKRRCHCDKGTWVP